MKKVKNGPGMSNFMGTPGPILFEVTLFSRQIVYRPETSVESTKGYHPPKTRTLWNDGFCTYM